MLIELDPTWKDWIKQNIERGCDKDDIARILFDHGFHPFTIINEMDHVPLSAELMAAMNRSIEGPGAAPPETALYQAIDAVTLPFARKLQSDQLHLYLVDDFLTADECQVLVQRIKSRCRPSTLTNPDEPDQYFRTSQTCDLAADRDALVSELDRRMAEYLGVEPERSEGIQGQYYQVGQEFKPHTDYFEPHTAEYEKFAGRRGQRTWTFMIYLNDVEAGGETAFPRVGLSVQPRAGMAVVWNSLRPDGAVNPDSLHWAKPVLQGEKLVITKWFRTHGELPTPFVPFAYKQLPIFTADGFRKLQLPPALFQQLADFHRQGKQHMQQEHSDAIGTFIGSESGRHPSHMLELTDALRAQLAAQLLPLLEQWVGRKLQSTAIYGIREYQRGATLKMHVDRIETHLVSAIINVAQQVDSDWALHICDHKGRVHKVLMQPGDLLFYESARLQHGRPEPLQGEYFANIFAHTMPVAV